MSLSLPSPPLCIDIDSIVVARSKLVNHIVLNVVAVGVGYVLGPAETSQVSQQKMCIALPTKDR